jgi:lysozyme family protein
MKENFDKSLRFVLASEGKFSNIPADRGGPTNQGITLGILIHYHAHFDYGDMDNDGDVDINDIRLLDEPEEAAPIYRRWFWDAVSGDKLPAGVDYITFDGAVNHGPKNAGIFLQRAINRWGLNLKIDGSIGPVTIKAVVGHNGRLVTDILRERDIFYRKIVVYDPSQEIFLKGWLNRLAKIAVNVREFGL